MNLNEGLIYTNDKCIGCNRCISECPVMGANVAIVYDGRSYVYVDNDKCLHCGHCLSLCHHNAREYRDDTAAFFENLQSGESISLLVESSFFAVYGKQAKGILGYIKSLGVNLIYDVSYGADIAAWAYLTYISEHSQEMEGAIVPQCSAAVNYIQKYSDVLQDKLIPVYSPLLCLAEYIRKYLGNTDRLAFLSSCIAKKDEIDDPVNKGLVSYNVTFRHLMERLDGIDFSKYTADIELSDSRLGSIYPVPGAFSDNFGKFIPENAAIREVYGKNNVFEYFNKFQQRIKDKKELPFLVDCLNCELGCVSGTAVDNDFGDDDIFLRICKKKKVDMDKNSDFSDLTTEERQNCLKQRFKDLDIKDFIKDYHKQAYTDEKNAYGHSADYEAAIEEIFCTMHKTTPSSRVIDCHSCGYNSCYEMAVAVFKGYNRIENCVHYIKEENYRISMIDARSGIPNLNAFSAALGKLIMNNSILGYATMFFNINNFKAINFKFGFRRGDAAFKEYCIEVSRLAGPGEMVAVVGGNNFVGIFRNENLDNVLEKLKGIPVLSLRDDVTGEIVHISSRAGVYIPDGSDTMPSMIIEKITTAFNSIDRTQGEEVQYYDEEFRKKRVRENVIIESIMPALEQHEFEVYYQPKVNMQTRRLEGAEALIRWNHNGEIIRPMDFIPICERTGLVKKLDFYVFEQVCRHIVEWQGRGIDVVPVSVNFSKYHFVDNTIAAQINDVAEKIGTPKEYLEVEFTETAYMEDERKLIESINKLHEYGISSSVDDFGTGYSSLSMLQNMSFDTLKLDKSFLNDGNISNGRNKIVIENIIKMAKQLKMHIVSEGIETEEELEYMKNLNCDMAQGYYFDKPLTHDEFEKRLIMGCYAKITP